MTDTTPNASGPTLPKMGRGIRKALAANVGVWLFAITLIAITPLLIFATIAAQRSAKAERAAQIALVKQRLTSMADVVEELISSHKVLAQTLAQSKRANATDREAFHALALRVQGVTGLGTAIGLISKNGEIVVNSRVPLSTPLPKSSFADAAARAIERRETLVTDLTVGSFSSETRFAVIAPVSQNGLEDHVVAVTVSPQFVLSRLRTDPLPGGWIATVIDSAGRIVARTRAHDERAGQFATEGFLALRKAVPNGTERRKNLDGETTIINYVTLPEIGWTVGIGVPAALFDEPLIESRFYLATLGLAAFTTALIVALVGGWYMRREVSGISRSVVALGSGIAPISKPSHVSEVNLMSGALEHAYARSREREFALRKSEEEYRAFFENAVVGVVQLDEKGRYKNVNQFYCDMVGYSREELLAGMSPHDLAHEDEVERERERVDRYLGGELDTYSSQKRNRRKNGEWIWVRVTAKAVRDPKTGERIYSSALVEDITEELRNAEHNEFLMREVNHRSKNLLTVVQAVARQTAALDDPAQFVDLFSRRLAGIAASHDLLVRSEWKGVDLGDLIRSQLHHFGGLIGSRIKLSGPSLQMGPTAAQTIGLAINELATNAVKYGALSSNTGAIDVRWSVSDGGKGEQLQLSWTEAGGPPVVAPTRKGFGTTVVVDMVQHSLEADVTLTYAPTGFAWQLVAPRDLIC